MESRLKQFFIVVFEYAKADFKLKNEGSYLGILWYFLNPLLMFLLLFFIFSDRLGNNIPKYPFYLLIGIIMFNFFQTISVESTKILRDNALVIKSVNFPREALIGAIVVKNFFSHIFEILVLFIIFLIFGLNPLWIFFYVFIVFFFMIFIYGISLVFSSISVFFIDINGIWNFVVRLVWIATPIFYAIEGQTRLYYLNLLNPLYYFITITREIILYHKLPCFLIFSGMITFSLVFLLFGMIIFNKLKFKFAEFI